MKTLILSLLALMTVQAQALQVDVTCAKDGIIARLKTINTDKNWDAEFRGILVDFVFDKDNDGAQSKDIPEVGSLMPKFLKSSGIMEDRRHGFINLMEDHEVASTISSEIASVDVAVEDQDTLNWIVSNNKFNKYTIDVRIVNSLSKPKVVTFTQEDCEGTGVLKGIAGI